MRVLALVLAGGEGRRLLPLTARRAKPAVPFGGHYRLIDFVLSNLVNGGFLRIIVLTQYMSHSLDRHLAQAWRLSPLTGSYVAPVPAQMRRGPHWFSGSADAIFQNLDIIRDERPDYVAVLGADHIYRMDPRPMLEQHIASGAGVTVAATPVPIGDARGFGIIGPGDGARILSFTEKPDDPATLTADPSRAFASMGIYIFTTQTLEEAIQTDAELVSSTHDLGGDLIPMLVERGEACFYDFTESRVPGQTEREHGYWRDVGSISAYYQASMDLVDIDPVFDLYNADWPILTWQFPLPPAKFVHEGDNRSGVAINSLVAGGAIVSGGTVRRSILSPGTRVNSFSLVEDSVLFDGVEVGRGAVVRRAIVDKNVKIPEGFQIGVDRREDSRLFTVTDDGVVTVEKDRVLESPDDRTD